MIPALSGFGSAFATPPFLISWPGGTWQDTAKIVGAVLITYIAVLWVAGLIWVYRDIRDRSRDPFYQALSVFMVLAFNLPGLWLYLILRPKLTLREAYELTLEEEALLQELEDQKGCPTCHRRVLDDYIVCPSCTTQLKEPCPQCAKPLSYSWVACPYCA
ncbi:MAG: zinc ribbon domain-containing protein, partial [Dehalococcoidia bacterium]